MPSSQESITERLIMQHEEEHHSGGEGDISYRNGRRCKPRSVNHMWLSYSFQVYLVFFITSWTLPCSVKCMSDRISKPIPSVDLKFTSLSPAFIYAQRGDSITLNCSGTSTLSSSPSSSTATTSSVPSSSTAQLLTSWRFEGEDIPPKDSRRILLSNGALSITKFSPSRKRRKTKFLLRSLPSSSSTLKDLAEKSTSHDSKKSDEGRYFCVIRNSEGALLSRPIDVIASRATVLNVEPHELKSQEGTNARLSCQINPTSQATSVLKYKWFFNDQPLDSSSSRLKIFGNIMQLMNISSSESGLYSCQAEMKTQDSLETEVLQSKPAKVTVLEEDSFREEDSLPHFIGPTEVLIRDASKEKAILECLTKYPSYAFHWSRASGRSLSKSSSIDSLGNLVIGNLTLDDEDDYICSVNVSSEVHSVKLMKLQPPKVTKLPQDSVHPSAQTARIDCEVKGSPPPVVSWFKDAQPISSKGRMTIKQNIHQLVISQTTTSDSGIYQCMAENEAGVVTAAARLTVLSSDDQPDAPTGLTATDVTSSSISLTWNPSLSPPEYPVLMYTVHFAPEGSNETPIMIRDTNFTFDKLLPFTNYSFTVRAYNKKGAGDFSSRIIVQTSEDVPIAAPDFKLRPLSSTRLLFTWKPLSASLARGVIESYEIHYRPVTQNHYLAVHVDEPASLRHILNDLMPGVSYQFRVLAATAKGFPDVSNDEAVFSWKPFTMPSNDMTVSSADYMSTSDKSPPDLTDYEESNWDGEAVTPPSSSPSKSVWLLDSFIVLVILVTVIAVLVLMSIAVRHKRQSTGRNTSMTHGQVPSLLCDSTPREVPREDNREMESFLDDGIRRDATNGILSSPKHALSSCSSNGRNRCRLNGNSVEE